MTPEAAAGPLRLAGTTYALTVEPAAGRWRLDLPGREAPALRAAAALPLRPVFAAGPVRLGRARVRYAAPAQAPACLVLRAPFTGALEGWVENEIHACADRFVCTARYLARTAHGLAHWQVLGPGGTLGLPSVYAYVGEGTRNLLGTTRPRDHLTLSTASHNFMLWNACPRMLFTDGSLAVTLGGTTLAHDYGLELRTAGAGRVEHLRFNYGGAEAPHPGRADAVHAGPRLQGQVCRGLEPLRAMSAFTEAMAADGIVPPHRTRPELRPWRRPWYCTWPDQVLLAETLTGDADWQGQRKANAVLTQKLVERAVRRIRDWELNIGTVVVDAGWQDRRGDWNLDAERFPDFRGLVDRLHDWGYKVHLWWAPLQVEPGAAVLERPGFTYPLPGTGEHALDYTNPAVRDGIVERVDRWFDGGPGGWDLDGLKLDWLCERIRPRPAPRDATWRGEERCLVKLQRLLCRTAARHKDAYVISSQPRNPHLATLDPVAGIPETFADDLSFPAEAAVPLRAWLPGRWLKAHAIYQPGRVVEHVRAIRALGPDAIPEIGLMLPETMPEEYLPALREALRPGPAAAAPAAAEATETAPPRAAGPSR